MADAWPAPKELRGMNEADLRAGMQKLADDLWQLRQKTDEGASQQTHRFGLIRRQIARMHTIMNEQRRAAAKKA